MGKEKSCNRPAVDAENMRRSYIPNIQNVNLKDLVNAMYSVSRCTKTMASIMVATQSTTHQRTLQR